MPSRTERANSGIDDNVWNFYTRPAGRLPTRKSALDLLTPSRLDIMARYLFVKHRELGWGTGYATSVYRALLEAWNPDFFDGDGAKNSFTDYLRAFSSLADSVATNGWDRTRGVLPYVDDTLVDGAHRLAVAIHHNLDVDALELVGQRQVQNATNLIAAGLPNRLVEALVQEYIHVDRGAYAAVFFPAPFGSQERAVAALDEAIKVLHDFELSLSDQGKRNLIELLYGHEPWWKTDLLEDFVSLRFPKGGTSLVRVVFVAATGGAPSRPLKERARSHLPHVHCLHMNDTHEETKWIADIVLNENGRQYLNLRPTKMPPRLSQLLPKYKDALAKISNPEMYCIDAGAVLAAFGLRDCSDIDYITPEARTEKLIAEDNRICWHNDEYRNFPIALDEVVANPSHHFSYKGVKFMSLNTALLFKKSRGEEKDLSDLRLIIDAKGHRPRKDWRRELVKTLNAIRYDLGVQSAYFGTKLLRTLLPSTLYGCIRDWYRARNRR